VAFALDTCDGGVLAWYASNAGISGELVRDLMFESVERRFGTASARHPIQVRSPQAHGMWDAVVKTFKRDYVYIHDCRDARTALSRLSGGATTTTKTIHTRPRGRSEPVSSSAVINNLRPVRSTRDKPKCDTMSHQALRGCLLCQLLNNN
jgi:hypothetical protein